nr:hypothetical protein BFBNJELC_00035 [uncultured bacterium]
MSGVDSETSADLRSINQKIIQLEEELETLKIKEGLNNPMYFQATSVS